MRFFLGLGFRVRVQGLGETSLNHSSFSEDGSPRYNNNYNPTRSQALKSDVSDTLRVPIVEAMKLEHHDPHALNWVLVQDLI